MNKKQQTKSRKKGNMPVILLYVLAGGTLGAVFAGYGDGFFTDNLPLEQEILYAVIYWLEVCLALGVQVILHETGHLFAGLCSGYRFVSFRIGSLLWKKEEGRIVLRRYSLPGTGGQCLMAPPDFGDGKMPVVFFNLGGVIMNFISVPVCAVLFFMVRANPFAALFMLAMCVTGAAAALINGIPMQPGTLNNDGYNAKELKESKEALRSFWVQMKLAEAQSNGVRLKDMPDEWFYLPDKAEMQNSMTAVMAVFYANRLMDQREFAKAEELMDRLLRGESGILGMYQNFLLCDRLYCELIRNQNPEVLNRLYTKELLCFLKQMRSFPSALRTEYAAALLYKKNEDNAAQLETKFEKCALKYPYKGDIESERELLDVAKAVYENGK